MWSSLTTLLWAMCIYMMIPTIRASESTVELHQFSLMFTNQLLFEHIDGSLNILSKHISNHFQDMIIKSTTIHLNTHQEQNTVLDIDLLKGQLQAAIASFVEDSLPNIWNKRSASLLEKTYLIDYVEQTTQYYCSNDSEEIRQCIESNSNNIVKDVSLHVNQQLNSLLKHVIEHDLTTLFHVTQQYVDSILRHFNHYTTTKTMVIDLSTLYSQLDLKLNLYLQSVQDRSTNGAV